MNKPIVYYTPLTLRTDGLLIGTCAYVYPVNHPDTDNVSNTRLVRTSPIVRIGTKGEFETENTRYRPLPLEAGQPNVGDE